MATPASPFIGREFAPDYVSEACMHAPAGKYCTRGHDSAVSATKVRVRLLTDSLVRAGPKQ